MVSKQHCPICGFLMMYSLEEDKINYTCVNDHGAKIKDESDLGPNLDVLMEFLKRP